MGVLNGRRKIRAGPGAWRWRGWAVWLLTIRPTSIRRAHLDTATGAPVSDPAGIEKHPETRRIGDRRSAVPVESRAVSRCALLPRPGLFEIDYFLKQVYKGLAEIHKSLVVQLDKSHEEVADSRYRSGCVVVCFVGLSRGADGAGEDFLPVVAVTTRTGHV